MTEKPDVDFGEYKAGWSDAIAPTLTTGAGLNHKVVEEISRIKNEPKWMREMRLDALDKFFEMPMPVWADPNVKALDFQKIRYYVRYADKTETSWEDVPDDIKYTFDRLGVPEAERQFLAGVGAQYDSETIYHKLREDLEDMGVIFLDTDTGLRKHEDIFLEHFGKIIPPNDNKFAALNTAVWSGGSFVLVPKGTKVDIPLQAYFRINTEYAGQFERTLIIAEPGSDIHYIEGCTAPTYTTDALHSAVVELLAMDDARIRYSTIQNWSSNVFNLVTKRAHARRNATVEWVDGNIGSGVTMKYPAVYLMGEGARGEVLSIAYAKTGQHQDSGAKMVHMAPNTHSKVTAKSISKGSGKTTYRGLVSVAPHAKNVVSNVMCDALLLDDDSKNDTFPYSEIQREDATITHEAAVGKINADTLFYLMSRGIPENEALALIVMGFFDEFSKELPMEYAVELNRLIELEMEGAVG